VRAADFREWIESLGFPVTPDRSRVAQDDRRQPTGCAGRIVARAANVPASRHSSIFLNAPFSCRALDASLGGDVSGESGQIGPRNSAPLTRRSDFLRVQIASAQFDRRNY
jgi:hypothetical protein